MRRAASAIVDDFLDQEGYTQCRFMLRVVSNLVHALPLPGAEKPEGR